MVYHARLQILGLILIACAGPRGVAEDYEAGKTDFGRNRYIEYLAGDLPFILSAPHGGREKPEELPDRERGTFAFDTNTQEPARAIAAQLQTRTEQWPHVILFPVYRAPATHSPRRHFFAAATTRPGMGGTQRR